MQRIYDDDDSTVECIPILWMQRSIKKGEWWENRSAPIDNASTKNPSAFRIFEVRSSYGCDTQVEENQAPSSIVSYQIYQKAPR